MSRTCAELGVCQSRPDGCGPGCNRPTTVDDAAPDVWAEIGQIGRETLLLAAAAALLFGIAGVVAVRFIGWVS